VKSCRLLKENNPMKSADTDSDPKRERISTVNGIYVIAIVAIITNSFWGTINVKI
jgi:hypothetical protein